ncbi:MAG: hypothetical protein ABW143_04070, partial [Acidimicrobiales bacterium]
MHLSTSVEGQRRVDRPAARPERTISRRAMSFATIGATLGLLGALTLVGTGLGDDHHENLESLSDRPDLPLGSPLPGGRGAEDTALDLAAAFQAVDARPGEPCPADQLAVSWDDPGDTYASGSHYTPVGPRPLGLESANGIVYCEGSDYDHAGFTADWEDGTWHADLAPDADADDGDTAAGPARPGDDGPDPTVPPDADDPALPVPAVPDDPIDADDLALPAPAGPVDLIDRLDDARIEVTEITDLELTDTWHGLFDAFPIEDLAPYEPQTTCSPSPKAGTYAFAEMVTDAFASTDTSGISRACDQSGRSEHKEGRAWDWSALVSDEDAAAAASQVIGWLLATDEHGNEYAMARRLGLMYIVYNQSIWRAYAPELGWVGYTGPDPHTDHVHFSFSRAGGLGDTSFWQVADLPDVDARDFGPYALLPDAGGVSRDADQPAVRLGRLTASGGPSGGVYGGHQGGGNQVPPAPGGGGPPAPP